MVLRSTQKMTRWNRLITHTNFDRIAKHMYNGSLPLCVRYSCAEWLENQIEVDRLAIAKQSLSQRQEIETIATNFLYELLTELANHIAAYKRDESVTKERLEAAFNMYSSVIDTPLWTYNNIREIMQWEVFYLKHFEEDFRKHTDFDVEAIGITEKIEAILEQAVLNREACITMSRRMHEYNQLEMEEDTQTCSPDNSALTPHILTASMEDQEVDEEQETASATIDLIEQIEQMEPAVELPCVEAVIVDTSSTKAPELPSKLDLMQKISDAANELWLNVNQVISEMNAVEKLIVEKRFERWTSAQKMTALGASITHHYFDELKVWIERLVFLSWMTFYTLNTICQTIESYDLPNMHPPFYGLLEAVVDFWKRLVMQGFVVKKQPPHIAKTNSRFDATVELLAVNIIDGPIFMSEVQVALISADQIDEKPLGSIPMTMDILNNKNKFIVPVGGKHLICNFSNLIVKKLRPEDHPRNHNGELVKYVLLFRTTVKFLNLVQFEMSCTSIPFILISGRRIDAFAVATSIWHNSFHESGNPFFVPTFVSWHHLVQVLQACFHFQAKLALSENSLEFLCEKVFKHKIHYKATKALVTWSMFSREPLMRSNFSFFDWVYGALRLVRDPMRELWQAGMIIGFASQDEVNERLLRSCPGTFVLRFSEWYLGGITISFVHIGGQKHNLVVEHLEITGEVNSTELSKLIRFKSECVWLYPNIPKDIAFGTFYNS